MTKQKLIKILKKKMPEMRIFDVEEKSFKVTIEDEKSVIDGIKAFDYYEDADFINHECVEEFGTELTKEQKAQRHKELARNPTYDGGIHNDIRKLIEENGCIAEWDNSGVVTISEF